MKIRKAVLDDVEGISMVHVTSWRESYSRILDEDVINSMDFERRRMTWKEQLENQNSGRFIYVCENKEGRVIGFAVGGENRSKEYEFSGELYAIYILQAYKGKKIGEGLVRAIVNDLKLAGYDSMFVFVLKENPSKGFYEHLGARFVVEKELKRFKTIEVGLGWNSEEFRKLYERLNKI